MSAVTIRVVYIPPRCFWCSDEPIDKFCDGYPRRTAESDACELRSWYLFAREHNRRQGIRRTRPETIFVERQKGGRR